MERARLALEQVKTLGPSALWSRLDTEWRDPGQIVSQWRDAAGVDCALLACRTRGRFWDVLAASGLTLLVTREYEHLIMAIGADRKGPAVTFMPMPHPSGIAFDRLGRRVLVASTRNPNQIVDLRPVSGMMRRSDVGGRLVSGRPLVPVRSRFFPGCLYMHDLAVVGRRLYVTSVGENAVVHIREDGTRARSWWPRCIDGKNAPRFDRNHIQLNSIAAGRALRDSYFSASAAEVTHRRPGQRNFPVDRRGVIFSGSTREPVVTGLTRPHSARVHRGRLWVDNSGYGELGFVDRGRFEPAIKLDGWTRGLYLHRNIAFVGTSRVLPRFTQYAPGLDIDQSICGVHAVDITSGTRVGSLIWPGGNQIFAIEGIPRAFSTGFPFRANARHDRRSLGSLFYAFQTDLREDS